MNRSSAKRAVFPDLTIWLICLSIFLHPGFSLEVYRRFRTDHIMVPGATKEPTFAVVSHRFGKYIEAIASEPILIVPTRLLVEAGMGGFPSMHIQTVVIGGLDDRSPHRTGGIERIPVGNGIHQRSIDLFCAGKARFLGDGEEHHQRRMLPSIRDDLFQCMQQRRHGGLVIRSESGGSIASDYAIFNDHLSPDGQIHRIHMGVEHQSIAPRYP